MALKCSELFRSGEGTIGRDSEDEYSAFVSGDPVADNAEDIGVVLRFALTKFSLVSEMGNIFSDFDRKRVGSGTWIITAKYKSPFFERQTNDASFSFTAGGGTQHITHSIRTKNVFVPDSPPAHFPAAPNFHGAIGVSGTGMDNTIAGCDIFVSSFSFKTTHYVDPLNLTPEYLANLKSAVGQVNDQRVLLLIDGIEHTSQSGELLLISVDGCKRYGFGDWELGFSWNHSDNQSGLTLGDGAYLTSGIDKDGQDYMWVYYGPPQVDATTSLMFKPAIGVYIEQVYPRTDLNSIIPLQFFGTSDPVWLREGSPYVPTAGLIGAST